MRTSPADSTGLLGAMAAAAASLLCSSSSIKSCGSDPDPLLTAGSGEDDLRALRRPMLTSWRGRATTGGAERCKRTNNCSRGEARRQTEGERKNELEQLPAAVAAKQHENTHTRNKLISSNQESHEDHLAGARAVLVRSRRRWDPFFILARFASAQARSRSMSISRSQIVEGYVI